MNRFIKMMLAGFALVSLLIVGSAVAASSAQAAGRACNPNGVCFYDTSTSWDAMLDWDGADTNGGACFTFPSAAQANTSYVWNRSGHQWKVYTSSNCSTASGPIYANTSGAMTGGWNNSIRSLKY